MRKRLENEEISYKPSSSTTSVIDTNAKSEAATKKSASTIAAEVADKLAASSSSQFIMTSVLETFAAEEAKNAGLASESMSKPEQPIHLPDQYAFLSAPQLFATPNHSYPSALVHPPTMQNPAAAPQGQYIMMGNSSSQQFLESSGGIISPYGYGSIPPLPPGPPLPMENPMMPLTNQTLQIPPQPQQQAHVTQHPPITMTQQAPAAPSFLPIQPPGNVYYGNHVPF
nr:unknown [Lotus japonicus]